MIYFLTGNTTCMLVLNSRASEGCSHLQPHTRARTTSPWHTSEWDHCSHSGLLSVWGVHVRLSAVSSRGCGAHKRVHQHARGRRKREFQLKWGRCHGRLPPTLVFVLAPITPVEVSNWWSGQTTLSWMHTITNNLRFYRPFRSHSLRVFPYLQVSPLQTER